MLERQPKQNRYEIRKVEVILKLQIWKTDHNSGLLTTRQEAILQIVIFAHLMEVMPFEVEDLEVAMLLWETKQTKVTELDLITL